MSIPFSLFERFNFAQIGIQIVVAKLITVQEERDCALRILTGTLLKREKPALALEVASNICDDSMRDSARREIIESVSKMPLPRSLNSSETSAREFTDLSVVELEGYLADPKIANDNTVLIQVSDFLKVVADPIEFE